MTKPMTPADARRVLTEWRDMAIDMTTSDVNSSVRANYRLKAQALAYALSRVWVPKDDAEEVVWPAIFRAIERIEEDGENASGFRECLSDIERQLRGLEGNATLSALKKGVES
jgi:hypothetical protein